MTEAERLRARIAELKAMLAALEQFHQQIKPTRKELQ